MADLAGLTNAFSTITGSTAKASILIADMREDAEKIPIPKKPVEAGSGAPGNIPGGSGLKSLAKKAGTAIKETAGAVVNQVEKNMGMDAASLLGVGDYAEFNKAFTVQFNPASLHISGVSGGSYDTISFNEIGSAARATALDTNYSLSVKLVFDQLELQNAFPLDYLDFSLTTAAKTAMKAVTVAKNGLSISVQAATEGLIAALQNPLTRLVCFVWGPMSYKGVIKSVNAQYKMFDLMGRPIRSEVALTLYLADKDIVQEGGTSNLGMWKKAYAKAFDDAAASGASAIKTAEKITKAVLGD
ncbi:MAG: hypothetical protein K6B14_03190 [Lachnospiraceae bacterium]|nr:hypothetical protein [Lachnospiraceae bacterium]